MKKKPYDHYQKLRHSSGAHHIPNRKLQLSHAASAPHLVQRASMAERLRRHWSDGLRKMDIRLGGVRRAYLALAAIPAFAAGALVGLIVLGWWLWPVQWVDAGLAQLRAEDQALYVELAADMYAIDHNTDRARRVMAWDTDGTAVCESLAAAEDEAQAARLAFLAASVRGEPCDD